MDFLTYCSTNVSAIEGFSNIYCRVYSMTNKESNENGSPGREPLHSNFYLLQKAALSIRHAGGHAVVTTGQQKLWMFGATESHMYKLQMSLEAYIKSDELLMSRNGQTMKCLWWGEFKAIQLLAAAASSLNSSHGTGISSNASRRRSADSPVTPTQAALVGAGAPDPGTPLNDIYKILVEALALSISYYMTRDCSLVPVNFRTFAPANPHQAEIPKARDISDSDGYSSLFADIDIELTADGILLISIKHSPQIYLKQINTMGVEKANVTNAKLLPLVRVAPSGRIFQFTGQTFSQQRKVENSNEIHNTAIKPEDPGYFRGNPWRQQVKEWLGSVGLSLPNVAEEFSWVLIATPLMGSEALENSNPRNARTGNLIIEWPMMLCFEFNAGNLSKTRLSVNGQDTNSRIHREFGIEWFQSTEQEVILDPLDCALDFLRGQESRDLEIKALQSRTTQGVTNESPANTTVAHSNENILATAIYPTPPDALPSGVTPGSSTLESNAIVAPSSRPPTGVGDFHPPEDVATLKLRTDDVPGEVDIVPEDDTTEDHLGNADDDLFESNGITEADFNFFDEPEMDIDTPIVLPHSGLELNNIHKSGSLEKFKVSTTAESAEISASPTKISDVPMTDSPPLKQLVNVMRIIDNNANERLVEDNLVQPIVPRLPLTPPLNPQSIRQDLNMQYLTMKPPKIFKVQQKKVPDPAWDQVKFHLNISVSDSKYTREGRFGVKSGIHFVEEKNNKASMNTDVLDNVQSPSNPRLYLNSTRHKTRRSQAILALTHGQVRDHSPLTDDEQDSDSSSSNGNLSIENSITAPKSKRRKYLPSVPSVPSGMKENPEVSIQATPNDDPKSIEVEKKATLSTRKAELLLAHLFVPNSSDWSLTAFPAPKERLRDHAVSSAPALGDYIEIAQIVATQAATSVQLFPSSLEQSKPMDFSIVHAQDQCVIDALKRSFAGESDLLQQTVLTNAEIREEKQDITSIHSKPQPRLIPRRLKINESGDGEGSSTAGQHVFPISAPRISVSKTESLWELLPSAFTFWETLGLGPVNGQKEVRAYCVYPQSHGIENSIRRFLDSMRSAWESCRLGDHISGSNVEGVDGGLMPVTIQGAVTQQSAMFATRKVCEYLGMQLAKAASEANWCHVIYLVNPFTSEVALRGLCACFFALSKVFDRHTTTDIPTRGRPILQIIPINLIASFDKLVFLDSQVAATLAREVYDRCPSYATAYTADLPITSAASTILAEPTPRNFHFQLNADPPSDLMHERAYLNVAYCISPDERWITAAWTDATGKYQHTACYNNGSGMTFGLIAQEIWESTLYYIKPRKAVWQIFIAKVGFLELSEKAIWQRLATTTPQSKFPINMVIVSVNTSPILSIYPGTVTQIQSPTTTNATHNLPATPITTPQAQTFSPGPTPPAAAALATPLTGADGLGFTDADPTARLIDITDESWGIVLGRRLSISRSLVEYNPALASGYLVKRTGPGDLDQPVVMEVNMIDYVEAPDADPGLEPRRSETEAVRKKHAGSLLRETLAMYRGLALLAKLRGMEDVSSCTPWHVSAAVKAESALRYSM